ncbi:hypothetical protein [Vibrio paucivorans]
MVEAQIPEVNDCYLAPGVGDSRMVILSIDKQKAGQAQHVLAQLWSQLHDKVNVKFAIVVDGDVNIRDWNDVIWAITTRMDPSRDTIMCDKHGSKAGLDATNKLEGEVEREWGIPITKDPELVAKIDAIWDQLGIL